MNENELHYVLVVGNANIESIYSLESDTELFVKQNFDSRITGYGGSGLNYTLRLLATGVPVFPILPLGNDANGKNILKKILQYQKNSSLFAADLSTIKFLFNGINTRESLILSEPKGRTIWSSVNFELTQNVFNQIIQEKLNYLNALRTTPKIVMIGHIYSDKKNSTINTNELSTQKLIDIYHNKSFIYANLGMSQLSHGFNFWKDYLKKLDILQLNLNEIHAFFKVDNANKKMSLIEILNEFHQLNVNLIITLNKFGALFVPKNSETVYYLSGLNIDNAYKDKTGAGDAFASGVVFELMQHENLSRIDFPDLYNAMKTGRNWGTIACTSVGSSSHCPTRSELEGYSRTLLKHNTQESDNILSEAVIDLLDKTCRTDI